MPLKQRHLTERQLTLYFEHLRREEKSAATVEKYHRDIRSFYHFLPDDKQIDKERVIAYKQELALRYKTSSVNSMLVALNGLFSFLGWNECRVRLFKMQRQIFCDSERELTKEEYFRLLESAKQRRNQRLQLLMQTICATGIRVSELPFITKQALEAGYALVRCKGKERKVLIPRPLQKKLLQYSLQQKIHAGSIFITKSGRPLNRSNIWAEMKRLCAMAQVEARKVFPHNLRHLFAITYYRLQHDIVRLADILGHSNIETTRIYTVTSGQEHGKQLDRLGLVI